MGPPVGLILAAALAAAVHSLLSAVSAGFTKVPAEYASLSSAMTTLATSRKFSPGLQDLYLSASADLGVTHCSLQGMLHPAGRGAANASGAAGAECRAFASFVEGVGGVLVDLQLFLKLVVQDGKAYLRGFGMLGRAGHHDRSWNFMANAPNHNQWSHELYLGSARTRRKYGPILVSRDEGEYVKYILPNEIHLDPEDAESPELEVGGEGFGYTCFLLPSTQSPLDKVLARSRTAASPLGMAPEQRAAIFMLAPFFNEKVDTIARMVHWSIQWHERLGFHTFVLYAQRDLLPLVELPEVQDLVLAGRLVVVHWDALPMLPSPLFYEDASPQSGSCSKYVGYWHKLITYNHWAVAMWMEPALVFQADFDEWIITPRPMTLPQIVRRCAAATDRPVILGGPTNSMRLDRRISMCEDCKMDERDHWMAVEPNVTASQHPLNSYAVGITDRMPKSIYFPELAVSLDPHTSLSFPGGNTLFANQSCAYVLHMVRMMAPRHYSAHDDDFKAEDGKSAKARLLSREELWPLYSQ